MGFLSERNPIAKISIVSSVGLGLIAISVFFIPDQITDLLEKAGVKDQVRPLYRSLVYSTLSIAGRNPMCHSDEVKAAILSVARIARTFKEKRVEESQDMVLYEDPHGAFWIPSKAEVGGFHIMMAEGLADIYHFKSENLKDAVVLDCGANVGSFTRTALKAGARKVIAIEPAPDLVRCLRRTFAKEITEGRVVVYPKGVWNTNATLDLYTSDTPWTNSVVPLVESANAQKKVSVQLVAIDELVPELGLERVDFIKMDIEGAETNALAGASQTIARYKPVLAVATEHTTDILKNTQAVIDVVDKEAPGYTHTCISCMWQERVPSLILPEIVLFRR